MHAVRRAIPTRRLYCTPAASALPKKKPFPIFAGSVYVGTLTAVLAAWLDERLDIRKWKQVQYNVVRSAESGNSSEVIEVSLRARTRPPPIGAMEWPAGRVLLQWSLDEALLGDEAAGTVLTLGEGIGVTAIGLAKARQQRAKGNDGDVLSSRRSRIVATDFCDDSLELLASNACASGLDDQSELLVRKWDAAGGSASVAALPVPLSELTHVIGADIVYHGFGVESDPSGDGLVKTLSALLTAKPTIRIRLMVVDRFSGGAVAALSGAAGVNQNNPAAMSTTVDPAVADFETSCRRHGLRTAKRPVGSKTLDAVRASQSARARLYWWLAGFYDGIQVYDVQLAVDRDGAGSETVSS